ncbi:hypothetical protein FRACYDRAFT_249585 [Fragilariopsis cylindrus CCMP1102]|uniref:Uncharacterized protein n=1 Tax=Fragilariopsis cylindrus CCMP1102 TaxID=635003 RepID=A0A1E7ES59_9STRA|nr:hypothetical protein FRACYDRAFT_249585 [Fragilariopsis cylindrus CCMP1102]|eukprot:OEU08685.1 hypothetical protein FRACYDRAFT_249585 [Fragilariopsis cylindrus CCMP1102]
MTRRTEAQTTCNSELGYYFPLLAVSDIRFNKLPPIANDNECPCDDYVNGCHKGVYPMLPTHCPFEDMANHRSIIQKDLEGIASAICGEYPGFHQQTFLESMFRKGIELYDNMKAFRSHDDFVGKQVRIADINTWTCHAVAAVNFMLK